MRRKGPFRDAVESKLPDGDPFGGARTTGARGARRGSGIPWADIAGGGDTTLSDLFVGSLGSGAEGPVGGPGGLGGGAEPLG